ncbi:MAG: VOC family protein [Dehalococcoidia bacterium]
MTDSGDDANEADNQLVLELYTSDIKRSTQWYQAWGFELVDDSDDHFVVLRWGGTLLFLEQVDDLGGDLPRLAGNIRVMVPDVDRYWTKALELGREVIRPIADRYYNLRDFTVASPDGVGLRFASPRSGGRQ